MHDTERKADDADADADADDADDKKGYVTDAGPILMMNRESGVMHGSAA